MVRYVIECTVGELSKLCQVFDPSCGSLDKIYDISSLAYKNLPLFFGEISHRI